MFQQTIFYSCDQNLTLQDGRRTWKRDCWYCTQEDNLQILSPLKNFNMRTLLDMFVLWLRIRIIKITSKTLLSSQDKEIKKAIFYFSRQFSIIKSSPLCCLLQDLPITVWICIYLLTLQKWQLLVHSCYCGTWKTELLFFFSLLMESSGTRAVKRESYLSENIQCPNSTEIRKIRR